MKTVDPRRPSGFPEYTPAQQLAFNGLLAKIRGSYEASGFTPIETPALELAEVLLAKGGGETEQEVFRFEKGSKDYVMHYDLTVPMARYVAEHQNDLVFPFRRSQIQKVWRAERAQKGRAREFYQCDADVVGETDVAVDGELIALAATTIRQLDVGEFTVRVNNRKILSGIYEALGVQAQSVELMRVIDKLEKIGEAEVRTLLAKLGLDPEAVNMLVTTADLHGAPEEVLAHLRSLSLDNTTFVTGLEELERVLSAAASAGVLEAELIVDCAIARGLDYYTSTVFETVLKDLPELGSVCSGGRYDDLAQYYTKRELPGVGISIGLTRLFDGLWSAGKFDGGRATITQLVIVALEESAWQLAGEVAVAARGAGLATELSLTDTKPAKVFARADKLGIPHVAVIGAEELATNSVMLKDMATGKQELLSLTDALKMIAR